MSKLDDIFKIKAGEVFTLEKAKHQAKDLILGLCDTHEVLFASKETADEFKGLVKEL